MLTTLAVMLTNLAVMLTILAGMLTILAGMLTNLAGMLTILAVMLTIYQMVNIPASFDWLSKFLIKKVYTGGERTGELCASEIWGVYIGSET